MKHLPKFLIAYLVLAVFACSRPRAISNTDTNNSTFDFSQFYRAHESDVYIYDAHHNVPLGKMIVLNDLDSIFGKPIMCDTVTQISNDWSLYEQECQAANFMPTDIGDTLIMMRRIYGKEGNWLIWIDLEIQNTDSLRVLNFIAYDNSHIDM